jgi:hypothetical protein
VGGDASTLENSGTISGGSTAVSLGATSRLIVDPTAVFSGTISLGTDSNLVLDPGATFPGNVTAGSGSAIELPSSASAGTLQDVGHYITGFSQVTVDPGASWTINSITTGVTLTAGNGVLTIPGEINTAASFAFVSSGVGETLTVTGFNGGDFYNSFSGLSANDEIVVQGASFAPGDTVIYGGNALEVMEDGTPIFVFNNFSTSSGSGFIVGPNYVEVACFRGGTGIATPSGEVTVALDRDPHAGLPRPSAPPGCVADPRERPCVRPGCAAS